MWRLEIWFESVWIPGSVQFLVHAVLYTRWIAFVCSRWEEELMFGLSPISYIDIGPILKSNIGPISAKTVSNHIRIHLKYMLINWKRAILLQPFIPLRIDNSDLHSNTAAGDTTVANLYSPSSVSLHTALCNISNYKKEMQGSIMYCMLIDISINQYSKLKYWFWIVN